MKIVKIMIRIGLIIVICIIIVANLRNPLRKPVRDIRNDLLEITPIGTNSKEVAKEIEKHRQWDMTFYDFDDLDEEAYVFGDYYEEYYGDYDEEPEDGSTENDYEEFDENFQMPEASIADLTDEQLSSGIHDLKEKTILVTIGEYVSCFPAVQFVRVYYVFDKKSNLTDIRVWKD